MDKLFGIPMSTIMWVLVVLFAICVGSIIAIWLSNRIMFRMGLRNIPRRGAQTVLVVLGLMLATLIITAAFSTGDSIDYSITSTTYTNLQRTDLVLRFGTGDTERNNAFAPSFANDGSAQSYVSQNMVAGLQSAFQNDSDIDGFIPFLFEPVPVLNQRTRLSEPQIMLSGIDPAALGRFGGLHLANGDQADLAALGENQVLVNKSAADKLDVKTGDTLTIYSQGKPWQLQVAGVVKDERASGALLGGGQNDTLAGMAALLPTVQRITGHDGQINQVGVALKGGVRDGVARTDAAAARLKDFSASAQGRALAGTQGDAFQVVKAKQDAIKNAQTFGNLFTTFFLVLGLFSIAAGVMLIFMIFVMLAAERKTEMGMARAVGAQRRNLVQSFVSEGMAYNVMAGAVGAALGVAASFLLIFVGMRLVLGDEAGFFVFHVTGRSLVISYCLGVVLTFITVVISSLRVSLLNIVAAIRGTDDIRPRETRRKTRWLWVVLGIPALVIPPLGLYWLLRKGFGLPWAWILGPLGVMLGALLIMVGESSKRAFPVTLGVSLLPLSLAALARYYRVPSRVVWTAAGAFLAVYWLLPDSVTEPIFGKLNGNIEMFVLSGIMIVTAFTLLIVFNARLLTTLFEGGGRTYRTPVILLVGTAVAVAVGGALGRRAGGLGQLFYLLAGLLLLAAGLAFAAIRFPRFAPALKMGVAYPLANRFRTGMTVAMFSLIVFSITMMSVMNANFERLFFSDDARASWDVIVDTNRNNPVPDLKAALAQEGSFDPAQITTIGAVTPFTGQTQVRQAGRQTEWQQYPVEAVSDAFLADSSVKFDMRARGYGSDREILDAVRRNPDLAFMDATPTMQNNFGGMGSGWHVQGIKSGDKVFDPFQVELHDPVTGATRAVTIIGVMSSKITYPVMYGVYTNSRAYAEVFGTPDFGRYYLRLAPGGNAEKAAKGIKAALVTSGVQAFSIEQKLNDAQAQSRGFSRLLQTFMALGLFVGIAALGVIAFRSVVERRQQIGMLRALGYQQRTVALTFLLESSFIAVMGILSGVVGAAILARNLMTSETFTSTSSSSGTAFFIPWAEVIVFVVVAYVFALLMTWWPSRSAARVPVAQALRYE
jgi:putative ABC transport system permease protein